MDDAVQAFRSAEEKLFALHGLTVRERWISLEQPALRTRVLECGEGEPLLLVHGGGAFASVFAPVLAELKGFTLYAVDRPGCGLTDPFDYRGSDLKRHAADFLGGVLDGLGLERCALVANCAGG